MSKCEVVLADRPFQLALPLTESGTAHLRAGSLRTKEAVHEALKSALNGCGLSREDVAKEMSRLVGEHISINTLNNWCAEGKTNRRFPLECAKALAMITGDMGLLEAALAPEFTPLDGDGKAYLEYGRLAIEDRERAKRKRELVEKVTKERNTR